MSTRGQRRRELDAEFEYESDGNDASIMNFNVDESDSNCNVKFTSTPLKRIGGSRERRKSSGGPRTFDSEESTDMRIPRKSSSRRHVAKSPLKKDRTSSSLRRIESASRGDKRPRKSKRRRSDGNKNDFERVTTLSPSTDRARGGNNDSEILQRQGEGVGSELPIVELLRKAQESNKAKKTRYEEPVPLPELTTDTLYVQGRNGFSAVKIGNCRSDRSHGDTPLKPIHVAIRVHKFSKALTFFCQGLLGGIALSQVLLLSGMSSNSATRVAQIETIHYPRTMSGIFQFLATVCLLASMDRIDLTHINLEQIGEVLRNRCTLFVTFPLYLVVICLHLTTTNDHHKATNDEGGSAGVNQTNDEEFMVQPELHTWKYVLCIVAWLCIALGPNDDMTTIHLEAMQDYAT